MIAQRRNQGHFACKEMGTIMVKVNNRRAWVTDILLIRKKQEPKPCQSLVKSRKRPPVMVIGDFLSSVGKGEENGYSMSHKRKTLGRFPLRRLEG